MRGRSMMEGLLAWIPAMDSDSPRLWQDCLTVREASESLVTKKSGQVSLTQLNPMEAIFLEMASMGCLLRPSVTRVWLASSGTGHWTEAVSQSPWVLDVTPNSRMPASLVPLNVYLFIFILITIFFFSFKGIDMSIIIL